MELPQSICKICLNELDQENIHSPFKSLPQHPCSHFATSICTTCADSWIAQKLQFINTTDEKASIHIKCPTQDCPYGISLSESLKCISLEKLPKTSQQLFINYCRFTQDVISCPNNACNYQGFAGTSLSCKSDFICGACNHKWKSTRPAKISNFNIKNIKSSLFKFFCTKNCPVCKSPIQKRGGCNNMTCSQCKVQFCWLCLNSHGYQFSLKCVARVIFKSLFLITPCFWMTKRLGFFEFAKSVEFIKSPQRWYQYLSYPFRMIGVTFRLALYCSVLLSTCAAGLAGIDFILQKITQWKVNRMTQEGQLAASRYRPIFLHASLRNVFGISTLVLLVSGCLSKLLGNKNEMKVFLGSAALSFYGVSSIIISSMF